MTSIAEMPFEEVLSSCSDSDARWRNVAADLDVMTAACFGASDVVLLAIATDVRRGASVVTATVAAATGSDSAYSQAVTQESTAVSAIHSLGATQAH